jgi:transposase
MPYTTEKINIECPFLDKRVKLLPCQKEMVLHYRGEGWSQRALAKHFNVSRRLITFVIDPDKKRRDLENRAARGGHKVYYDREKNNTYMKSHRAKKHILLKDTVNV